jgi:hypothetical protein
MSVCPETDIINWGHKKRTGQAPASADNCPVEHPCKEKTGEEIVLMRSFINFLCSQVQYLSSL